MGYGDLAGVKRECQVQLGAYKEQGERYQFWFPRLETRAGQELSVQFTRNSSTALRMKNYLPFSYLPPSRSLAMVASCMLDVPS
jgi:hypothetical protein